MYNPTDHVFPYLRTLIKRPEGVIFLMLFFGYVMAFVFFPGIVAFGQQQGLFIENRYRLAFALMPLALIVTFLRMDINAKSLGDRILTIVVLIAVSAIPVFHFFR